MARNGSGVYSLPAGYAATDGATATAAQHNDPLEDLASDANTARPVVAGGTGATTASAARSNLGLGSIATQAANSVDINGGTVDGAIIGESAPAAATFTSINGSSARITSGTPSVSLLETDPGVSDYAISFLVNNSGRFEIQTRDANNTVVSVDYQVFKDAGGATDHVWQIQDAEVLRVDATGLTVTGELDFSGVTNAATVRSDLDVYSQSEADQKAPPGMVAHFARNTAPTGWLKADGSNVSRTTYADLFAAIGTTFGAGDGSTTFGLPDLRGEFVRGWDDSRGVDSARAFGSAQLDQMQRITGEARNVIDSSDTGGALSNGGTFTTNVYTSGTSGVSRDLNFDSADSPNARVSSTTDGETRPRNIALLVCIKH